MLNQIAYPTSLEYSSDWDSQPIEFYIRAIPHCKRIDLKLGYFSSNAIRTLSYGFAQFIFNGGILRIITNHYLSEKDKSILVNDEQAEYKSAMMKKIIEEDLSGLQELLKNGDQHFFDCLRYLYNNERLIIVPVKLKPGKLSHYKQGILDDGKHQVFFSGSCNFTYNGILENGESLSISRSWGDSPEKMRIEEHIKDFDSIFSKTNSKFEYLEVDDIIEVIKEKGQDKELYQLVEDEINVLKKINNKERLNQLYSSQIDEFEKKVYEYKNTPRFPYPSGPRDYQKGAYEAWLANDYKGVFAMATGTGKTITSLNCLLELYKTTGKYQALILVPTNDLQVQWVGEVENFNIHNVITVGVDRDWKKRLSKLTTSMQFGTPKSFVVISTYASFVRNALQNFLRYFPKEALLIADEAHNIAAPEVKKLLPTTHLEKRIGLSATPKRIYDPEGTDEMNLFFNDEPPYTYEYSMEEAIAKGVLCQYEYYPHLVPLDADEMEAYKEITLKLVRFFDSESGSFSDPEAANMLLMKRKRIIHKASYKLEVFKDIVKKEFDKRGNLKYTFVYVPEGFDSENEDDRLMMYYNKIVKDIDPSIRVSSFTGETKGREATLDAFENGDIDVLSAMKCLDEGVDVPRTELAIFCSSTGNPRQFIQRRGRILRTHDDKDRATIHDLVVIPTSEQIDKGSASYKMERSIVRSELRRVADFAYLAINQKDAVRKVEDLCIQYELDLFEIKESIK